ncbi:conserved hypothetical protein [Theileria orientalis strain Shintoku]|uniref:Uncharacterized protein n=1 Tax=Theileria orientalis strain Shintoku TaxID=869250 RepID=J4CCC9_THEOR|nr:conserved hypothetical protein [Theileria orientalis strain Shintoku]BAM39172.1 conserved hypothetical protein [Theileria orientalis strain Shintoku]|eukprot:XP_009689473.1 conserved hypothetical protein [Theileria orientalis strain Shintoku]
MEDDPFRDNSQTVLTCNDKNYLNSIISGDLNETVSYFNDYSEEETELYINTLLNRLTALDKDIWYSVEVIQSNACGSLNDLRDILKSLPDRDVEFKKLAEPLKRVENLTVSIERKYDKTYKLRQLKNLKALLTSNQKVLSLIYNWDDNIKSVQALIASYLSHKESFNLSNKESFTSQRADARMKRYLILGSDGFGMEDLDELKQILSQLKSDYDTCLNNVVNTNIPQTLGIIMDKYYIILEDLTVDIVHFVLLSYNFYSLVKLDLGYQEDQGDQGTKGRAKEFNADVAIRQIKLDKAAEDKVKSALERYVKYYILEDGNGNMNLLNRHLKNKLEELFMNQLRLLCAEKGLDLFARNKEEVDLPSHLEDLSSILNSFLKYLFLVFTAFKGPFYSMAGLYVEYNQGVVEGFEADDRSKLRRERSFGKEGSEVSLEDQLEESFRKLVVNTLSACILNSNVFYLVSTLKDDEALHRCLTAIFTTFEDIFVKFRQYLKYLTIDSHLEYMNFIPFDILDKYISIVHSRSEASLAKYQHNYSEFGECVNGFKHLLNQLNNLQAANESDAGRTAAGAAGSQAATADSDSGERDPHTVLNWLHVYCALNAAKVEFDLTCDQVAKYVTGHFSGTTPKVQTNPINTAFEVKCRDFMLELLELQKGIVGSVESLLASLNPQFLNTMDRNVLNCLKEKHDWKLSAKMLDPFREVVFGHRESAELVKEFEMNSLLYSISQNVARFISRSSSYLLQFYHQPILSNTAPSASGHEVPQTDSENVNMYVELIGEYYINLISAYYEHSETFAVLQRSMELFIDSEFETTGATSSI